MLLHKIKSFLLPVIVTSLPTMAMAATSQQQDEKSGNYNMVLICLVSLMLILLFVVGMLANTLRQLAFVVRDKIRKDRADGGSIAKTILLLIAFCLPVLHLNAAEAGKPVEPAAQYISGIPVDDFYLILGMLALEFAAIFALVIYIRILLRVIANKPELVPAAKAVISKSWFWDKFNAAVPMEKEKDLLLDHDYDGIQELDNSLPPWWKYGFYLTILVSMIYLYRFHISHDGLSPQEEYAVEMKQGEENKAAYLAHSADNVDENSVVLLKDPAAVSEGHELFVRNCAPCHLPDGGGNVGPNLTDDYWLHGGGIKDIFKSIKYGWQDKGMKSWKDDLSPKQIQQIASFIKSLKGSHPVTPKAPQGELYIEAGNTNPTDSIKGKTDTTAKSVAVVKAGS